MLKFISICLVLSGGGCIIANCWNDLGHFVNHEVGNERKYNFWKHLGTNLIVIGLILSIINFLFM